MGIFGNNATTQTSSTAPWGPARKPLKYGMGEATRLYKNKSGFGVPNFSSVVPFSGATNSALSGIENTANQGNPLAGQSMDAVSGILGGDINNRYNDMYANSGNQAFEGVINKQAGDLSGDIGAQFGEMGRYGSGAMTGAIADQVGDFRNKMASDNWYNNINAQRGILGDQVNSQLGAVSAAPGAYDQQFAQYERLAQVGGAREDLATRRKQEQLDKFNTRNMAPWERLKTFMGQVGGPAGQGGSTPCTGTPPTNWFPGDGGILGGAGLLKNLFGGGGGSGGLLGGLRDRKSVVEGKR